MTEPESIEPNQLQPGPVRRESLSPEMLELIESIYELIGLYLSETLEGFKAGFLRDTHPEAEISSWCSIASAWLAYHDKYLHDEFQEDVAEKKLVDALILISAGVNDAEVLGVPIEVGLKLIACFNGLSMDDLD